jgi:hypothetical protein
MQEKFGLKMQLFFLNLSTPPVMRLHFHFKRLNTSTTMKYSIRMFMVLMQLLHASFFCEAQTNMWTWVYGSDPNQQNPIYGDKGVASTSNNPGTLANSVSWTDKAGNYWLFGGSILWKWEGTNWTWIKGNPQNPNGNYGTKGISDTANYPSSRSLCTVATDSLGNAWIFGGYGPYGELNELWKWDGLSWTWISGSKNESFIFNRFGNYGTKGIADSANIPGVRYSSNSWCDTKGNFWLFGGFGYGDSTGTNGTLNDLWKWDGKYWTWINGKSFIEDTGSYGIAGVMNSTNLPSSRSGAISWLDKQEIFWLFGGENKIYSSNTSFLSDLWKWDGANWTLMRGTSLSNQSGHYNSIGIADPSNIPGARKWGTSWTDKVGNLWLFGGTTNSYFGNLNIGLYNDLWRWNGNNWICVAGINPLNQYGNYGIKGVTTVTNYPGARYNLTSAWSDSSGNAWIYGGTGYGDTLGTYGTYQLNDLWKFDGKLWTWLNGSRSSGINETINSSTSNSPGSLTGGTAWVDNAGKFWLFGGIKPGSNSLANNKAHTPFTNELWKWDRINWNFIKGGNVEGNYGFLGIPATTNLPPARRGCVSWKDYNGITWIFGGGDGGNILFNDLWKWDGTYWTWYGGQLNHGTLAFTSDVGGFFHQYGIKGLASPGNLPSPVENPSNWLDSKGILWVFGGISSYYRGYKGYTNDL